ncbi:MAG: hypothetical protein DRJ50_01875 [Actinobacteria bacterium]|nr:MAG: hypothetical protein DRJ50_01875 [Actinomycetota bacterium]
MTEPLASEPSSDVPVTDSPPFDEPPADEQIPVVTSTSIDLDAIERDLTGVEVALSRLAEGTYWTDEISGAPLPDHVLAADPTARRA